MNVTDSLAI